MTREDIHDRLDDLETLVEQQRETIELLLSVVPSSGGWGQRGTGSDSTPQFLPSGGQPTKVIGSLSDDDDGIGVFGEATGSGSTYGVRGDAPNGHGLYTPDDTRLDGALVGQSLTDDAPVTSLLGSGIGLETDSGALTTTYIQDTEQAVGSTGTFWVSPAMSDPLDSYDDGTTISAIAYGDDGYVYAGGNNAKVYRLDPGVSLSVSTGEEWESVV